MLDLLKNCAETHQFPGTEITAELIKEAIFQSCSFLAEKSESQTEDDFKGFSQKYKLGQIIWTKEGSCPYWPSIVSVDQESKSFQRTTSKNF